MAHATDITALVTISIPDFKPRWGLIGRYVENTKLYSSLRLVVELTVVCLALEWLVCIALALSPWGASYEKFYHARKSMMMIPRVWILPILVAPLLETVLCQWIPIKMASLFTSRPGVLVIVSAIIFAVSHGNPYQAIEVFAGGLILGWVFVMKGNESFQAAFWLTAAIHMAHNVIAVADNCLL